MLKTSVEVDGDSLRFTLAKLGEVDPKLTATMRKELRVALAPVAQKIQARIPRKAPLSGMVSSDRLAWGINPKVTTSVTPGRTKRGTSFISFKAGMTPEAGFMMAERAGSRGNYGTERSKPYNKGGRNMTHRLNGQGREMVRNLNMRYPMKGKGGRWAFDEFRRDRPLVIASAVKIVDKYIDMVNKDFN